MQFLIETSFQTLIVLSLILGVFAIGLSAKAEKDQRFEILAGVNIFAFAIAFLGLALKTTLFFVNA